MFTATCHLALEIVTIKSNWYQVRIKHNYFRLNSLYIIISIIIQYSNCAKMYVFGGYCYH